MKIRVLAFGLLIFFLSAFLFVFKANATHSWGGYHWARTANPFSLNLADNVSLSWDTYLNTTSSDWSVSNVLDTPIVAGRTLNKNCKATSGRVEVCNSKYGNNGWLGIASIWISGLHITQGVVKVNDTYFNTVTYNTPAWRNLVMCQEVGHTLGLDHQDENFSNINLGTCMDYTDDPSGLLKNQLSNEHPNTHDYEELETIYAHLDLTTTVKNTASLGRFEVDHNDLSTLGREIRTSSDKRTSLFEKDFGGGNKVFTFVTWAGENRGR